MQDLLLATVHVETYAACWNDILPPYPEFIEFASKKFAEQVSGAVSDFECAAKDHGPNRIRLDGTFVTDGEQKIYYAEFVWLPAMNMFRGNVSVRLAPAEESPLNSDFAGSDDDVELIPVFIPPLVVILAQIEKSRGVPLTESEVLEIRDKAICMVLRKSMAEDMAAKRGYGDLDPEVCWEQWCEIRQSLREES
jgi:hypothetical protein